MSGSIAPAPPPRVGVAKLLEDYDGFLLDAYGVLLDRSGALPGARAFLAALDARNIPWLVVTNAASHVPEALAETFAEAGLRIDPARILTAGAMLAPTFARLDLVGARCLLIGPPSAGLYVERAGGHLASPAAVAAGEIDALIVADQQGLTWPDDFDRIVTTLLRCCDAGRPPRLLLCNPDLIYPLAPGRFGVTAGAVAALLEVLLRERYPDDPPGFLRLGKPSPLIFDEAWRRLGARRPVMLGDQLHTDIRGALESGIAAVLVGTGLAPNADPATWSPRPTAFLPHLRG